MAYEDDMSRLVGRYLDAQIRRKDYDRWAAQHAAVGTAF